MKSKRNTKKLEFKKETIARLGELQMEGLMGGHETITNKNNSCTCLTNATERKLCTE